MRKSLRLLAIAAALKLQVRFQALDPLAIPGKKNRGLLFRNQIGLGLVQPM